MARGLTGKVFVLGLAVFGAMALAPQGSRSGKAADAHTPVREHPEIAAPPAARGGAPHRMTPTDGSAASQTAFRHPDNPGRATDPQITPILFARPAFAHAMTGGTGQAPRVFGTHDAPPEYLARQRSEPEAPGTILVVTGRVVNLRAAPTTKSTVVSRFTHGTKALLLRTTGNGWAEILDPETGRQGYMSLKFLSPQAS